PTLFRSGHQDVVGSIVIGLIGPALRLPPSVGRDAAPLAPHPGPTARGRDGPSVRLREGASRTRSPRREGGDGREFRRPSAEPPRDCTPAEFYVVSSRFLSEIECGQTCTDFDN